MVMAVKKKIRKRKKILVFRMKFFPRSYKGEKTNLSPVNSGALFTSYQQVMQTKPEKKTFPQVISVIHIWIIQTRFSSIMPDRFLQGTADFSPFSPIRASTSFFFFSNNHISSFFTFRLLDCPAYSESSFYSLVCDIKKKSVVFTVIR